MEELFAFIDEAGKATYAGGGAYVEPERQGFRELVYARGDFSYRDSYAGFYRSRGTEVVRWKEKPIWSSFYGGGMVAGQEDMASQTFDFLKIAFRHEEIHHQGKIVFTHRVIGGLIVDKK